MEKTIFLYVHGADYSALDFKRECNAQEIYEDMISESEVSRTISDDGTYMEIDIVEFGEVDSKFISFMKNELCDYEGLKSKNIFEVRQMKQV